MPFRDLYYGFVARLQFLADGIAARQEDLVARQKVTAVVLGLCASKTLELVLPLVGATLRARTDPVASILRVHVAVMTFMCSFF